MRKHAKAAKEGYRLQSIDEKRNPQLMLLSREKRTQTHTSPIYWWIMTNSVSKGFGTAFGMRKGLKLSHIRWAKDKLEDMDVALIFCHRLKWAMVLKRPLWPFRWVDFKSQGAKWKVWSYGRCLSYDTFCVCCRTSGLVTLQCQTPVLVDIFGKYHSIKRHEGNCIW